MPELEEDELRDFYAAVMDSGKPAVGTAPRIEAPQTSMGKEERRRLLERMARRLLSPSDQAGPSTLPASLPRVRETVTKLVDKLRDLSVTEEEQELVPSRVSLGLASRKEWEALLDETTRFGVAHKAEEILELMSVSLLRSMKQSNGSRADSVVTWNEPVRGSGGACHGEILCRGKSDGCGETTR